MTALIAGPRLSISLIRARYFSAIERAVYLPDFIPACKSLMVASSISKGFTGTGLSEDGAKAALVNALPPPSRLACRKILRFIQASVRQQPFGFARQIVDLRQNGVLQLGMISHPGIERTYAAHGGVQAVK